MVAVAGEEGRRPPQCKACIWRTALREQALRQQDEMEDCLGRIEEIAGLCELEGGLEQVEGTKYADAFLEVGIFDWAESPLGGAELGLFSQQCRLLRGMTRCLPYLYGDGPAALQLRLCATVPHPQG